MTLTVRLPKPLEDKLQAYCADAQLTKSQVVQECLASYLVQQRVKAPALRAEVSPAYAAFRRAGLVGAVDLGAASATRDVVRQRMDQKLRRAG